MSRPDSESILTLEPLLDAVREGVETAGWTLSGLQKTTSHQFEGRWAGDSTRSAYLFFHRDDLPDEVSVDIFLDETSRGLGGNLALVVEGRPLAELDGAARVLSALSEAARSCLPPGYQTPVSVRFRIKSPETPPREAESECRIKLKIPRKAIRAGHGSVSALAATVVRSFESLLDHPAVVRFGASSPGGGSDD